MTKVDLITGFLGSGKTTFIRKYVEYLLDKKENVCILENDYGAINVDMMLLADLEEKGCGLEMVAGGCDYDCHRRRFKTKLITMAMLGYNRVIIEPSGIFDVDEFFEMLPEETLDRLYEIGNVIAIVKADLENDMSVEADCMLASQLAEAGMVLLSRVQEVAHEQLENTVEHINDALKKVKCDRKYALETDTYSYETSDIYQSYENYDSRKMSDKIEIKKQDLLAKNWDELTKDDYERIENSGYKAYPYEKKITMDDNSFDALFFMNLDMKLEEIKASIKKLFMDKTVGKISRVKGFAKDESIWYEINATEKELSVNSISNGQDVIIVIGENLDKREIDRCFSARFSTIKTS
ncbi:MAG: GTPase (G3E family) [Lachnospiraceae bacterium]|nr:GTPase (G3E family) [Lachnospiraceae bacterium]